MTTSLVVRRAALGDFVLTLPVLRALTTLGPVHVATHARYAPLLPPGAVLHDDAWLWRGDPPPIRFDRAVAFGGVAAEAVAATGIPTRATTPRPPPGVHAVDHYATVLDLPYDRRPRVHVAPDPTARGRVVLAPGSGGREKRWPLDRWRAVADRLPAPPIWVRGPDEIDEPGWPDDARCPDLPALAALAAGCDAWLGPDAGPSHLAAAVREDPDAVGVIFGPTDPTAWAPVGARVWPWNVDPADLAAALTRFLRNPDAAGG